MSRFRQIINLLADLKKPHHLTYIIISHDLSVVSHVSDRVIVMYQGRIVNQPLPNHFFRTLPSLHAVLLAAAPQLRELPDAE